MVVDGMRFSEVLELEVGRCRRRCRRSLAVVHMYFARWRRDANHQSKTSSGIFTGANVYGRSSLRIRSSFLHRVSSVGS